MSESVQHPPALVGDATPATRAEEEAKTTAPREERARLTGYRSRFNAIYVALALAAGVAIGAFIVVALDDSQPKGVAASPGAGFRPSETGELGAMQIAEVVQRNYRLPDGGEFVNVVASRNTLQDGNLGLLRVRFQLIRPTDAAKDKDSHLEIPHDPIQFSLCGSGASCAIPGQPTEERGLLLRGMGLELAIRTMQFDPAIDNVAVFLGPIPAEGNDVVVLLFRRDRLAETNPALLSDPIKKTLPNAGTKVEPGQLSIDVLQRIHQATRSNLYLGRYQLIGGRDALLQLRPVPNG
jgi:hypothetical protein